VRIKWLLSCIGASASYVSVIDRRMRLHPQLSGLLSSLAAAGYGDLSAVSLEVLRNVAREAYVPAGPPVYTREIEIPGPAGPLRARLYSPPHAAGPLHAGLVFFGAGFYVVGELSGHTALCQQLSVSADCVVVSVTPRLAPEHPFPAAVEDAYAAVCWIHENAEDLGIDHHKLAVGGESSGATLATTVCRLAKERRNPPLSFQLLLYPVTDLRPAALERVAELVARANANMGMDVEPSQPRIVTPNLLARAADMYLGERGDGADPRCSPNAASNLIGLPPALIVTAEQDALREQIEEYAEKLRRAQTQVVVSCYEGVGHGFVHMFAFLDRGQEALVECGAALRTALDIHVAELTSPA